MYEKRHLPGSGESPTLTTDDIYVWIAIKLVRCFQSENEVESGFGCLLNIVDLLLKRRMNYSSWNRSRSCLDVVCLFVRCCCLDDVDVSSFNRYKIKLDIRIFLEYMDFNRIRSIHGKCEKYNRNVKYTWIFDCLGKIFDLRRSAIIL